MLAHRWGPPSFTPENHQLLYPPKLTIQRYNRHQTLLNRARFARSNRGMVPDGGKAITSILRPPQHLDKIGLSRPHVHQTVSSPGSEVHSYSDVCFVWRAGGVGMALLEVFFSKKPWRIQWFHGSTPHPRFRWYVGCISKKTLAEIESTTWKT